MLNYFKTKYSLAHPLTYFENKLLYHPIGVSDKPVSNVCPLGNYLSFFLAMFVLIRYYLHGLISNKKEYKSDDISNNHCYVFIKF